MICKLFNHRQLIIIKLTVGTDPFTGLINFKLVIVCLHMKCAKLVISSYLDSCFGFTYAAQSIYPNVFLRKITQNVDPKKFQ